MKSIFKTAFKQIIIYNILFLLTYFGLIIFIKSNLGHFDQIHKGPIIDLDNLFIFIDFVMNASIIFILLWIIFLIVLSKLNIINSISFKFLTSFFLLILLWLILSKYKIIA